VKYVVSIARFIFALVFLLMVIDHFSVAPQRGHAIVSFVEPFFGMLAIWSALTIMVGFKARWSAWFVVFFVVYDLLTNAFFHTGPFDIQSLLNRNLSLLAASLMIAYFGAGPLSIDYENKIRSKRYRRYHRGSGHIDETLIATSSEL
jgi:putative oxidoreductase